WRAGQSLPPPDADAARIAAAGATWMLTPARTLTLVHAVQQPLLAPQLQTVTVPRDVGATFVYFGALTPVHGSSTAKLDLFARWQETVDRPDEPAPRQLSAETHVFDVPIHLPGEDAPPPRGVVPVASYDAAADTVRFNAPALGAAALPEPNGNG